MGSVKDCSRTGLNISVWILLKRGGDWDDESRIKRVMKYNVDEVGSKNVHFNHLLQEEPNPEYSDRNTSLLNLSMSRNKSLQLPGLNSLSLNNPFQNFQLTSTR